MKPGSTLVEGKSCDKVPFSVTPPPPWVEASQWSCHQSGPADTGNTCLQDNICGGLTFVDPDRVIRGQTHFSYSYNETLNMCIC